MPVDCSPSHFRRVTEKGIYKLVMSFPSKSCKLDPFPIWLLRMSAASVVPVLTQLVNYTSLSKGYVVGRLKGCHVRPLLKRSHVGTNIFKNFCSVGNLPFVSRLLEGVAAHKLSEQRDRYALHDLLESA